MERSEDRLGNAFPAATQREIVEEAAQLLKLARNEMICRPSKTKTAPLTKSYRRQV
jgi:hypothetical protein